MSNTKSNLPITAWSEADRPRERLLEKGRQQLSDAELLGILLGSGNKHESAVELSKRILFSIENDLNKLGKLSVKDLMKFKGIGEAKAITIVAALELGRRRRDVDSVKRLKIISSKDVFDSLFAEFEGISHEEFWVLFLDRSNHLIRKQNISKGGVSGTVVDA